MTPRSYTGWTAHKAVICALVMLGGALGLSPAQALPRDLVNHYTQYRPSEAAMTSITATQFRTCMRGAISTVDYRDCYAAEYARVDVVLNRNYQIQMRRLSPADQSRLRTAQRGWLRTRDIECRDRQASEEGGSLGLLMFDGCALAELQRRTLWLGLLR